MLFWSEAAPQCHLRKIPSHSKQECSLQIGAAKVYIIGSETTWPSQTIPKLITLLATWIPLTFNFNVRPVVSPKVSGDPQQQSARPRWMDPSATETQSCGRARPGPRLVRVDEWFLGAGRLGWLGWLGKSPSGVISSLGRSSEWDLVLLFWNVLDGLVGG